MLFRSIRVSVVCPGYVATRIMDSARNRPAATATAPVPGSAAPAATRTIPDAASRTSEEARRSDTRAALRTLGLAAESVARQVVATLHEPRFYVFTHPERKDGVRVRTEGILAEHEPRFVPLV